MSDNSTLKQPGKVSSSGISNFAIGFVFIAIVVAYVFHLSKRPLYNSDMLAYMAIPLQLKGLDAKRIHDSVYTIAQSHIPAKDFKDLTGLNKARVERYQDYRAFYEYLRFFRLKPLYTCLVALFYKLGVNLVFATVLPALIFTAGLLAAFYVGLQRLFTGAIIPMFIGLVAMLLGFTNELAVLSTPDAMSSFFAFLLFLNLFFRGRAFVSYLLLTICVFTRIDNLVFLPFILYYYSFNKIDLKTLIKATAIVAVLSIVVLAVPYLFGNHLTWFKDFIFKPSVYVSMVKRSIGLMRTDFNLLFLLICVLGYFTLSKSKRIKTLFTGTAMIIATRFLLFPSYEERFYLVFKLMLIFLIVAEFSYGFLGRKSAIYPRTNSFNRRNSLHASSSVV